MSRATLVIPCFNERKRLRVPEFAAALRADARLSFVLVDDGSTDGTCEVLEQIAAHDPARCTVVRRAHNGGKAEAVRDGMLRAQTEVGDYLGYWDADLSTPLEEVNRFWAFADAHPEVLAVLGSRVAMLGRRVDRRITRHVAGRVIATLISATLGVDAYDTQCGAKLFRDDGRLREVFARPFRSTWVFDVELLARLRAVHGPDTLTARVREFPVMDWCDVAGSKVKPIDAAIAVRDLLAIRREYGSG